ncbi:MAG: DUF262 domain-containing protein, partial [Candidatus Mucispirillum faecigallinarum]|nr:DUF262 domain-containing protein [Candidatus Mucispirillum faecigallinarum]
MNKNYGKTWRIQMYTINNLFNQPEEKKDRITKIVIPAIQRDYVQGLQEYSAKFDIFLNILFNGLIGEKKISLDFIYGNIHENGVFEPIDGQQRITTLALLYYYIVNIRQKKHGNNIFKHISYETRESATKFCKLLREDEFTNYLSENLNKNIISTIIKNYYKYYDIYDYDLTIESMINSLDKIENKYNEYIKSNQNFDAINDINFDNISFHIFPMESFNLSDDLYIKMNGRGKQLSSFDNFKADYFKWLEENEKNIAEDIIDIKNKFNNEYIDIFWDFTFANNDNKLPDPEKLFFRFINRFIVGKYLLLTKEEKDEFKNNKEKNEFEEIFFDKNGIKSERDEVKYQQMDIYAKIFKKNNNHKKLINILNNLLELKKCKKEKFKEFLLEIFTSSWKEKIDIFTNDVKNALTMQKVLIFNTIISYFEIERDFTNIIYMDNILKRISRIVWNIAEQFNISTHPTLINRENYHIPGNKLSFISQLGENDVYNSFISEYENFINNFDINNHKNELIENIIFDELIKCRMIVNDEQHRIEEKFISLESLDYLHGTIGFLLLDDKIDFINNHE